MPEHSRPVAASTLSADHVTVVGIKSLSDYQSINPDYTAQRLVELQARLLQTEQADTAAAMAAAVTRQAYIDASHEYHDAVVGARAQVVAQYGPDSAAVALVGLTRKSERKRPSRRKVTQE